MDACAKRVLEDTCALHKSLEPRPCRRAVAMLLQCVPVLSIFLIIAYVGWGEWGSSRDLYPHLPPAVLAFMALWYALLLACWLATVVCGDLWRVYATCGENEV